MAFHDRCSQDYGYVWEAELDYSCLLKFQAFIPSFRNAALQQKPMLLETLLTNAIESKSGFDKVPSRD